MCCAAFPCVLLCCAFLLQDIALFEAIISDLFPDTQLPTLEDTQLLDALTAACWGCGLQPEDSFVSKALQLHDTLGVRFGVMLVGPAGEGPSHPAQRWPMPLLLLEALLSLLLKV